MASKKLNLNNYSDAQYTEYKQFLRKKYTIPNNYYVVVKQGFVYDEVRKVNPIKSITNDDSFKIRQLVNNDIKNEVAKIHSLLDTASEEIYDLVQFMPMANTILHLQAELIVDDLFAKLSDFMNELSPKIFKRFLIRLNENSDDKIDTQLLNSQNLPQNEVYAIINSSLENLKKWFLDNIEPLLGTSNNKTQKGFLSDAWSNIQDFFGNLWNKINGLIHNIVSRIQTSSKLDNAFFTGYDKYQIVPSWHSQICDKCQQMAGKFFDVNEAKIGTNAPPFHPNCQCTIERKKTDASIDEPLTLVDPSSTYDREVAVAYALQWAHKHNNIYPNFGIRGDCANFVLQCLLAGGYAMNGYWFCYPRENYFNPLALFLPYLNWNFTDAWSSAKVQYEYLKNSNIVTEEVVTTSVDQIATTINDPESPVKVGDIMYLQWNKDHPHHATIISKIEDGMIFFAAHTKPYDAKPLSEFFNEHPNGSAHILKIK